ncbi:hypothetical protein Pla22_31340 [Rubripirellula amarantea]|uniref:Uncharacterized protein n=1 Tax=Rubripirellula amarantea TaxID=2527999 RepID=A0A5C5WKP3_9BACT|nr:hypothetical protein Pla22_31340 [Rubripirellula amarantea]
MRNAVHNIIAPETSETKILVQNRRVDCVPVTTLKATQVHVFNTIFAQVCLGESGIGVSVTQQDLANLSLEGNEFDLLARLEGSLAHAGSLAALSWKGES